MTMKWTVRAAAAFVAATVAVVGTPVTANATPVTAVTCTLGTFQASFSPPVKLLVAQDTTNDVEFSFTNCVSLAKPLLSSGTAEFSASIEDFSCLLLLQAVTATFPIYWDTGDVSNVTVTSVPVGTSVVLNGTVNSGLFAGQPINIVEQSFPIQAPVECLTDGLAEITGAAVLDILL